MRKSEQLAHQALGSSEAWAESGWGGTPEEFLFTLAFIGFLLILFGRTCIKRSTEIKENKRRTKGKQT